jgi:FkbM family methyltransferase
LSATGIAIAAIQLDNFFAGVHAESREQMIARERNTFDRLTSPFSDSIVLFGAGRLGKYIATGLVKSGIRIRAFADNDPRMWGTEVLEFPVLKPEDAVRKYGANSSFAVTIYHGSSARKQLQGLGCKVVVPFVPLCWKYGEAFIPGSGLDYPHLIRDSEEKIRDCFSLLADEASRREFVEQLRFRYCLDSESMTPSKLAKQTYFLVPAHKDEVFADCGALDGDSIQAFIEHSGGDFRHVIGFEPDPHSHKLLASYLASLPEPMRSRATAFPYAVGSRNEWVEFDVTSSAASKMTTGGSAKVECRKLDDVPWPTTPTYIKMDIEGAEPEALAGGGQLLASKLPVLAVCVYHRSQHLWEIPSQIHSISGDYDIFLRRYAEDCWELVCYAVPRKRAKKDGILH